MFNIKGSGHTVYDLNLGKRVKGRWYELYKGMG